MSESIFESLHEKDLFPDMAVVREIHDFLLEQGKSNEAVATGQIIALMGHARALQTDLAEVWKRAERVRGGDALADELTVACDAFRKREKEIAEALDDAEKNRGTMKEDDARAVLAGMITGTYASKCEIEDGWSLTQGFSIDHFVNGDIECGPYHDAGKGRMQYDAETKSASYAAPEGRAHGPSVGPLKAGDVVTLRSDIPDAYIRFTVGRLPRAGGIAQLVFSCDVRKPEVLRPGLPFTYTDDIGQIGEHDVFFGGVELSQDVGEFKAGTKFACAVIDFKAGHLTLEEHQGREHRYNFALKVGAKHEGHTCTGCGSVVGQPCRQHA